MRHEIKKKLIELDQRSYELSQELEKAKGIEIDDAEREAFEAGAEWADKNIVDKLRELKSDYEKDLDAEQRVYERDIQLCAKISLIERLMSKVLSKQ